MHIQHTEGPIDGSLYATVCKKNPPIRNGPVDSVQNGPLVNSMDSGISSTTSGNYYVDKGLFCNILRGKLSLLLFYTQVLFYTKIKHHFTKMISFIMSFVYYHVICCLIAVMIDFYQHIVVILSTLWEKNDKWARGICIFIMHTFIHIFYFHHLGKWRCCVDRTVPEAIHNQVAIKLLVSGVLTWCIYCVHLFFYILTGFVFKYFFRDSYLSF